MKTFGRSDAALRAQAGFLALPELRKPWVEAFIVHRGRTFASVRTRLSPADRLANLGVRWGYRRMEHRVLPGLYACGRPTEASPVFVTANYKMSVDALRTGLAGIPAWILVLDTKGVNVWCAAGKGSFGTEELVSRIASTRLGEVVAGRSLVLPQLGASGVAAPEVVRRSGFRVEWGPVRASDIQAWLDAGRVKDEAMRTVTFGLRERMAIAPIEVVHAWPLIPAALVLGLLWGLPVGQAFPRRALYGASLPLVLLPVGTLAFPALLPWLPPRAFALKGALLGVATALAWGLLGAAGWAAILAAVLVAAPVTAFLGMNFTGASTFTCQPGALAEVEKGFWPMAISLGAGLALGAASRIFGL